MAVDAVRQAGVSIGPVRQQLLLVACWSGKAGPAAKVVAETGGMAPWTHLADRTPGERAIAHHFGGYTE